MAINTYNFLDKTGSEKLATDILSKVNTRIGERIVQALEDTSSDKKALSAAALYGLLGAVDASTGDTVNAKLNGVIGKVGTTSDAATGDTAFAKINKILADLGDATTATGDGDTVNDKLKKLDSTIKSLTHLEIETHVGPIEGAGGIEEPDTSKLYFQKDDEDDEEWSLFIYQAPDVEGEDGTWIEIGNTQVKLTNYWSKDEADKASLQEYLGMHNVSAIGDDDITASVNAAFTATAVTF